MKKIELSCSQLIFILEKLPNAKEILSKNNSSVYLSLRDEELEYFLDRLSDLFSEIGIQEDSEPNDLGYFIESIIDDLGRAFYENK